MKGFGWWRFLLGGFAIGEGGESLSLWRVSKTREDLARIGFVYSTLSLSFYVIVPNSYWGFLPKGFPQGKICVSCLCSLLYYTLLLLVIYMISG